MSAKPEWLSTKRMLLDPLFAIYEDNEGKLFYNDSISFNKHHTRLLSSLSKDTLQVLLGYSRENENFPVEWVTCIQDMIREMDHDMATALLNSIENPASEQNDILPDSDSVEKIMSTVKDVDLNL